MTKKFNRTKLAELQAANLPHVTSSEVVSVHPGKEQEAAATLARMDEYFKAFTPMPDGKCICCGEKQGGDMVDALMGTAKFKWALTHGEGFCSECGYPGRAMHYIGEGEDRITIRNYILQYHPEGLSFEEQPEKKQKALV